jgi:hypothetical protein
LIEDSQRVAYAHCLLGEQRLVVKEDQAP